MREEGVLFENGGPLRGKKGFNTEDTEDTEVFVEEGFLRERRGPLRGVWVSGLIIFRPLVVFCFLLFQKNRRLWAVGVVAGFGLFLPVLCPVAVDRGGCRGGTLLRRLWG